MLLTVDFSRYVNTFDQLFQCGGISGEPGLTRLALSKEDTEARRLFITWMKDAGLLVRIDDIGNIYGLRQGTESDASPVVIGSHIDTVRNGGRFDGIVGVLAGLEVIRTLNDNNIQTRRSIVICIWSNEEGVRFLPGMMGSGVISGALDIQDCYRSIDPETGIDLKTALQNSGFLGDAQNRIKKIAAYLELHIEQGPILDDQNMALGIVKGVKAMSFHSITVTGVSNHAGPSPMDRRSDALLASATIIKKLEQFVLEHLDTTTTCTFGKMEVFPNEMTTIPSKVIFSKDLRSESGDVVKEGDACLNDIITETAEEYHVQAEIKPIANISASLFDPHICQVIENCMDGNQYRYLYSGAGHDAFRLSKQFPSGMIFIRTKDGLSHCPSESADFDDIEKGLNVLLLTAMELADER